MSGMHTPEPALVTQRLTKCLHCACIVGRAAEQELVSFSGVVGGAKKCPHLAHLDPERSEWPGM